LANGVFVGFSGENGAGLLNGENPLVYLDLQTGIHYHFISNDDPAVGRFVGFASTANSLFLADMFGANGSVVYQVSFVPEPATWVLAGAGLLWLVRGRRRR
jgi:PEP-CTERM motif